MKKLTFLLVALTALLFTAACAGIAAAESIKGVSEIAAANAIQNNEITVAQLSTLSTDLAALPQTPLPPSDNKIIANIIVEATTHKAATPTDAAAVDALNGVLADLTASHAPTPSDGIAWANLQDAILGFRKAITLAQTP